MKKLISINLCVVILMFMTAGMAKVPASLSSQAESLISGRIQTLNSFYSGEKGFDTARTRLEQIETGRILKEDTARMKAFADTEVDRIPKHSVKIRSCRGSRYGIVKGEAEITYLMEGQRGKYRQKSRYYFTGEKDGSAMKLTQLKTTV